MLWQLFVSHTCMESLPHTACMCTTHMQFTLLLLFLLLFSWGLGGFFPIHVLSIRLPSIQHTCTYTTNCMSVCVCKCCCSKYKSMLRRYFFARINGGKKTPQNDGARMEQNIYAFNSLYFIWRASNLFLFVRSVWNACVCSARVPVNCGWWNGNDTDFTWLCAMCTYLPILGCVKMADANRQTRPMTASAAAAISHNQRLLATPASAYKPSRNWFLLGWHKCAGCASVLRIYGKNMPNRFYGSLGFVFRFFRECVCVQSRSAYFTNFCWFGFVV